MERPRGQPHDRPGLIWGGDTKPYYESMAAVGEVADGATIVDCPCGAGPALRALEPGRDVRYVAADLSPAMLRRVRERAAQARGSTGIEFVETRAEDLPLETASADLFLSLWGIHCFPDPRAAMAEIGRVLKPGGRLVGASFVRGPSLRQRLLLRPHTGRLRADVHRAGAARVARRGRHLGRPRPAAPGSTSSSRRRDG